MKESDGCAAGFIGAVIGSLIGFIAGLAMCDNAYTAIRNGAVDKGHAEYYLDDKHERQWRWKNDGCAPAVEVDRANP
jgi:uncharacterized protein YcfJ